MCYYGNIIWMNILVAAGINNVTFQGFFSRYKIYTEKLETIKKSNSNYVVDDVDVVMHLWV